MKSRRSLEITINALSKKGFGTGIWMREDGAPMAVEIPFTLAGDRVKATLQRKRQGRYLAKIEEILTPSPKRITPRCRHFGDCGGCLWQHIPYADQLKEKQKRIESLFTPLITATTSVEEILPCTPPWHYRNKMEFTFSSDRLGLIAQGSRGRAFDLQECHLCSPWFTTAISAVRQWWRETGLTSYYPPKNRGSLRNLTLREGMRTGDRMVMLTVSGNPEEALTKAQLNQFVAFVREAVEPINPDSELSIFLRIQQTAKGRATQFFEMHLFGPTFIREKLTANGTTLTFQISPTSFFQPNPFQAEKLYTRALELAGLTREMTLYDLYCGTGTVALFAGQWADRVFGIEQHPESVLDAQAAVANNNCPHVSILQGAVSEVLTKQTLPPPDVVIVNPPRAGLDPLSLEQIASLRPAKILSISCYPPIQAENSAQLIEKGYTLRALQPVDQFPQTAHIENIALLERTP